MIGPFVSYEPPGVYTRTLTDNTIVSLTGGLRIPLLIGVGDEDLSLVDYELVRGSSAQVDNVKTLEDVSSQFDGLTREFTTLLFPIVTGNGDGEATFNPNDVQVFVNGQPIGAAAVDGPNGKITLSVIPREEDEVKVTYYFKNTDTLIGGSSAFPDADDLSAQADGSNTSFKVSHLPIVDGSNGGIATTDPADVTVTIVRGSTEFQADVSLVDGQNGVIVLADAPLATDQVLASYYTNRFQDTFDYLPVDNVTNVVRCGTAPGRIDFTNTLDFVIKGDKILWGNSFLVESDFTQSGTTPFESQVQSTLHDNKVIGRPVAGDVDGVNKEFFLEFLPTEGTGLGKVTDDPSKVMLYVGDDIQDALASSPVEVSQLDGSARKVTLREAPAAGKVVLATFWHNRISDDTYVLKSVLESTSTTPGEFTVESLNNGTVYYVEEDKPGHFVQDPNFATEGIKYPDDAFDVQTVPGFGVEETVLLEFFNDTDFYVMSSIGAEGTNGSGTLGQTYIDEKTGFRFTVMPGDTVTYQSGDILEYDIRANHKTGAPANYNIPGLKVLVNDLAGVLADNTALLETFNKSGQEPDVGDFYFLTVDYAKTDYPIRLYTQIKDVVANIGSISVDNRLSLAASLAFSNGAVALALAQVPRGTNGVDASFASYDDVLRNVETPLKDSGVRPNMIVPLTTDQNVINEVRLHCERMSTQRNKGERTGVFGFAVGTTPEQAQQFARNQRSERMVGLYPDGAVLGILDEFGNINEAAVDGSFLAASFAGLAVSPTFDVATPLTNKRITGFRRLIRTMDSVTMNQTAVSGLTVLEDLVPDLLIRHALTTNPATVLTREPSVIYIKDFTQQQVRAVLDPFIGIKFLPTVIQDVESAVDNLMNQLINLQIIAQFKGTSAEQDENDPTILRVETFYSPVFPLNWITVTLNLRVRL